MPYISFDPTTAAAAPATTAGAPLTSVGETLVSMQTTLLEELSGRADATTTRLTRWINQAYRALCGMVDMPQLRAGVNFNFVANQPFYKLPASVMWIHEFAVQDDVDYAIDEGIKLRMIDQDLYRTLQNLVDEPRMYFRYGPMVVLYPTPLNARVGVMDFRVRPTALANATDSPLLPEEFHEALVEMAKYRAFRHFRLYQEAQLAMNDALSVIRPILNAAAEESANAPSTLTPIRSAAEYYRGNRW